MKKLILLCLTVCLWSETGVLSRVVQVEITPENTINGELSVSLPDYLGIESEWYRIAPVKYDPIGTEWDNIYVWEDLPNYSWLGYLATLHQEDSYPVIGLGAPSEVIVYSGNIRIGVDPYTGVMGGFGGTLHISVDFPIEVNSTFLGDVNVDGETNITDIVILVNYIIGTDN